MRLLIRGAHHRQVCVASTSPASVAHRPPFAIPRRRARIRKERPEPALFVNSGLAKSPLTSLILSAKSEVA